METSLTDEQLLLRETASRIAADVGADPETIEARRHSHEGQEVLLDTGLYSMRLPEALGGVDSSTVDVALVTEALATSCAVVPFAGPVIASELMRLVGPVASFAQQATGARETIAFGPRLRIEASEAVRIWDDAGAATALQVIPREQGFAVRSVVRRGELPSADLSRLVASGEPGDPIGDLTSEAFARWSAFALTILAADMVGVMAGALGQAVAHVKDRRQFGRPLGSFQALQHLLAEALVLLEGSRSAVLYAAWATDSLEPTAARLAAHVAKAQSTRAVRQVTETTMQVNGGMGLTWECPSHLFMRRGFLDIVTLGDEREQLLAIVANRLGRRG